MITRPELPPKSGYVEVESLEGRTYMNVETGELIGNEARTPTIQDDVMSMTVDHEYRLTLMELGV